MRYVRFDIIYEIVGQNGENDYLVDPFIVNIQVYETKLRFTNMILSLGVLSVLSPRNLPPRN